MKALNVEVLHCLYLHARNSRKHNASDGYAAAIWLVVVRKVCEQDAGRVRQGGVISAVAVGHRQAALAVMCRG